MWWIMLVCSVERSVSILQNSARYFKEGEDQEEKEKDIDARCRSNPLKGLSYITGLHGLTQDYDKALELYHRQESLVMLDLKGVEKDKKRATH